MPKDPALIGQFKRTELKALWNKLRKGNAGGFPEGKGFEHLMLRAFRLDGVEATDPFEVRSPLGGSSPQEQVDGVLYLDGLAFLVESKHWKDKVPFGPVASMLARLRRRPPSTMGLVVGAVGFTDPARELLQMMGDNRVLLWNGDEVTWALEQQGRFARGLRLKYRQAVERALPDFSLLVGGP